MDRHAAFDEINYPNSWQIFREHQNLAGRPLKPGVISTIEMHMDLKSKEFLDKYISSLPLASRRKHTEFDSYHFCTDEENANICAKLVLKGEKRATAGLLWGYEEENEPLPEIGQLTVITNWEKIPQCIIETTSVEIRPFKNVDSEFAYEEGEGDKSLDFWKKEHWKFFEAECEELNKKPNQEMPIVLERFKVVYKA